MARLVCFLLLAVCQGVRSVDLFADNEGHNCTNVRNPLPEHEFEVLYPTTASEWTEFCSYLRRSVSCFAVTLSQGKESIGEMAFNLAVYEALEVYYDLCVNESTKEEFLNNAVCLGNTSTNCGKFLRAAKTILEQRDVDPDTIVGTICCSWKHFVECNSKSAEESCGLSEYITQYLDHLAGYLFAVHCDGYKRNPLRCSCPERLSPRVFLTSFIVIFCLMYC